MQHAVSRIAKIIENEGGLMQQVHMGFEKETPPKKQIYGYGNPLNSSVLLVIEFALMQHFNSDHEFA